MSNMSNDGDDDVTEMTQAEFRERFERGIPADLVASREEYLERTTRAAISMQSFSFSGSANRTKASSLPTASVRGRYSPNPTRT